MTELNSTTATAVRKPMPVEQWSPSGAIITSLVAGVAVFFVLTIVTTMALMAAMVTIDVPH